MKKINIRKTIWEYLVMTAMCFLYAIAWEGFMIPAGMSSGGIMGLCTVLQYATGGLIEASISYIVINALLIVVSVLALGIAFGFRTLYCIAMISVALRVVGSCEFLHATPGNFLFVQERLLIPVIAGFLEAVTIGTIINNGGSTGGTDIIAIMINKYWPVAMSKVFLITDFVIVTLILFLPDKNFGDMIYGYVFMVVSYLVIDIVLTGNKNAVQLMVLSDKYDKIADYVAEKMERGVTVLKAQGWYSKKDKNALMIVLNNREMPELSKMIKDTDPSAFISVSNAKTVYGMGFEQIKTGFSPKKKTKEGDE